MSLLLVLAAWAGAADHVKVVEPYVRPLAPGQSVTAGYFFLDNDDAVPHALVGVTSPIAKSAELHTVVDEGGVKEMRQVQRIEIPAHGRATLAPTGNHVMIFGVQALAVGQTAELTLRFEDGSTLTVTSPVQMLAPSLTR